MEVTYSYWLQSRWAENTRVDILCLVTETLLAGHFYGCCILNSHEDTCIHLSSIKASFPVDVKRQFYTRNFPSLTENVKCESCLLHFLGLQFYALTHVHTWTNISTCEVLFSHMKSCEIYFLTREFHISFTCYRLFSWEPKRHEKGIMLQNE